jgi:hypothetical protein
MSIGKVVLQDSAEKLLEKADNCFDLAKTQRDIADKEHENAARQHNTADRIEKSATQLDRLGHALEAQAVEITGEAGMVSAGTSDCRRESPANVRVMSGPFSCQAIPTQIRAVK